MSKYDLEERTALFSENIINFCKTINQNEISRPLINQLIRAGTSIGANYHEANGTSSRRDFKNKIHICKKEAQETKYWLRLIINYDSHVREKAAKLWAEAQELTLIFGKIVSKLKN